MIDEAQKERIQSLYLVVQKALGEAIDDHADAAEVMLSILCQVVNISKQIEMDENEFFDWVVRVYGWVHLDPKPSQH